MLFYLYQLMFIFYYFLIYSLQWHFDIIISAMYNSEKKV